MKGLCGTLLLSLSALAPVGAQTLDDQLLLEVGKRGLKESPDVRCVRGPNLDKGNEGISDWLLERLRRSRSSLTRCSGKPSYRDSTELVLGPVRWTTQGTNATVYFKFALTVLGQSAFYAEIDALGRWSFVRMGME